MDKPSIVDTISQYLPLKPSGKEWKACCPFHEDKHPSFSVNEESGVFYCFGCGAKGDVFDFLMKWSGKDFWEVCRHLGIHGISRRVVPDETRIAAQKIKQWSVDFSNRVACNLRHVGQAARIAHAMLKEPFADRELLSWLLNACCRKWTILESLHEDLANPEYLLELYEQREALEGLMDGTTIGASA